VIPFFDDAEISPESMVMNLLFPSLFDDGISPYQNDQVTPPWYRAPSVIKHPYVTIGKTIRTQN
jgi:hypothetical protein